jgi:asparagine N-glycosylation enzyme membrane subunit Stt3
VKPRSLSQKPLVGGLIVLVLFFSVLSALKLDYDNHNPQILNAVSDNPSVLAAFQQLWKVTPQNAIIFAWWDYGTAIQHFGLRTAVVSYPSSDITDSIGLGQTLQGRLELQLFGQFDSSQKIHDVARAFLSPESEALTIMKQYGASYVLVFYSDVCKSGGFSDTAKFLWIARIAGENFSDYLTINTASGQQGSCYLQYLPGPNAGNSTMMRLIFNTQFPPQHFSEIFENDVARIYQINYP